LRNCSACSRLAGCCGIIGAAGMSDDNDRLATGLYHEIRRAMCNDIFAAALVADYARLKLRAHEPLDASLRAYAPTGTSNRSAMRSSGRIAGMNF